MSNADRALVLFDELLALPEAERAAFLDAACDGDDALRARVEALLRADAEANPIFEARPADLAAVMPAEPVASFEGRTIGPYRIEREIGRGGMGAVYLAERDDVGKRVALKLVAGGMASPDRIDRFLVERRVLARLDHPGIARLLDAGVTEDGTPWFAMEYVEGESLDAYCDARRLSIPERLALFESVCEAVAYAHRNLIVHRDLKPSNILVTEDGEVKLLDFGIARLLEDETDGLTRTGVAPMTPDFAAPEQVLAEPITAATDVYQLGVVLYDLLSGHRPYRLGGKSLGEIERQVVRETPTRPSVAVGQAEEVAHTDGSVETVSPEAVAERRQTEPGRLRRRLGGELDAVVMKALAKEPERRYAMAEGLLDDVRRYRAGHPVMAQPDSRGYRARKFVGRHPVGLGFAALLLTLTVGFGVFYTVRVTTERDLARLEAEKAERVSAFLTDLFDASDPYQGMGLTTQVGELLERGTTAVEDLQDQPEVQAEMLAVLGSVLAQLGEFDRAQPMLERTLALRRERLGENHLAVASSMNDLGEALALRGRADTAFVLYRQAYDIQDQQLPALHLERARTLGLLGVSHVEAARYEEGEADLRTALDFYQRLLPYPDVRIAEMQVSVGRSLVSQARYDETRAFYQQAIETYEALPGQHGANLGILYNNIAGVYAEERRYAEAEPFYRQALAAKQAALPAEHPSVGIAMTNLASVLQEQGKTEEVDSLYLRALALQRAGSHHRYVVSVLTSLGFAAEDRQDYPAAEAWFTEALTVARDTYAPDHPQVAAALVNLGWVQTEDGRAARGAPLLREALSVLEGVFEAHHWQVAEAQQLLGDALVQLSRYPEAEALLLQSLTALDAECSYDGCTEPTLQSLVALYEAWGQPERAAQYRVRLTEEQTDA